MSSKTQSIILRKRVMKTGRVSLYLDVYINGKRTYEYLHLYLIPEHNRQDKETNKTTLRLAEDICAKRLVELRNNEYGFKTAKNNTLFFDYFKSILNEKSGKTKAVWQSCLHHLLIYEENKQITFKDITPAWINGFKKYLSNVRIWNIRSPNYKEETLLSNNSANTYFCKLKAVLRRAEAEDIISKSLPIIHLRKLFACGVTM